MIYPTIKQLRYFTALCETQHFRRAAETCFVSQSAFSTAIQDLESLLGVQLVDRTNRQVTITATGQEVAAQARLCLRDVESLVEIAGAGKDDAAQPTPATAAALRNLRRFIIDASSPSRY
jgi:LysR family hydrogen peroxide-inducible transcriptional activator